MRKVLLAVTLVALGVWTTAIVAWSALGETPQLTDAMPPANVAGGDFEWHDVAMPGGGSSPLGVTRAADGKGAARPAVLLVTGTEGLNVDYPQFARELAVQGFDVAVGCWFRTEGPTGAGTAGVACPQAPGFAGVSADGVAALDALARGARLALGGPNTLALVGFSRGGGVAMLRAASGAPDPVVSVSGMLAGTTAWGNLPDEVDVVALASGVRAPVLLVHGEADEMVPITQAQHMADALHAAGAAVETHWYPDAGHGLAQVPGVRADLVRRIAAWLPTAVSPGASRRATR